MTDKRFELFMMALAWSAILSIPLVFLPWAIVQHRETQARAAECGVLCAAIDSSAVEVLGKRGCLCEDGSMRPMKAVK